MYYMEVQEKQVTIWLLGEIYMKVQNNKLIDNLKDYNLVDWSISSCSVVQDTDKSRTKQQWGAEDNLNNGLWRCGVSRDIRVGGHPYTSLHLVLSCSIL